MMRALVLLHRWLGVVSCLLFAMWFASGAVMHFVPFPAPSEADRFAGLAPLQLSGVVHDPAEAVSASGLTNVRRVKVTQRTDGPVYLLFGPANVVALHASDLSNAAVQSPSLALAIAKDYASRRQWDASAAGVAAPQSYDQWTLAGDFDRYRPLYLVSLHDTQGNELYVSVTTGEVVLNTTFRQRAWNYVGSVAHWIYPTVLRSHRGLWNRLLWWLSLLASIGAGAGALIGALQVFGCRGAPAYRGWQKAHHWLGLCCGTFVLTWIFSGFLSMDDGLLFSAGNPTDKEASSLAGTPPWSALPPDEIRSVANPVREVEWFAFAGKIYRRVRATVDHQELFLAGATSSGQAFLRANDINAAAARLAADCGTAAVVTSGNAYPIASTMPEAPVFRLTCGRDWFDIDGASGALLEKLDASRRAYRWLFEALHTLDFPVLVARPTPRTILIILLCSGGFVFSITGVILAWRRAASSLRATDAS